MKAPAAIEVTDLMLRQAWARLHRPTWPASYEAAMADAVLSRLVRISAAHPPVPKQPAPQPAERRAPLDYARSVHWFTPPPGYVDHKRAAAGDRDD